MWNTWEFDKEISVGEKRREKNPTRSTYLSIFYRYFQALFYNDSKMKGCNCKLKDCNCKINDCNCCSRTLPGQKYLFTNIFKWLTCNRGMLDFCRLVISPKLLVILYHIHAHNGMYLRTSGHYTPTRYLLSPLLFEQCST